MGGLKSVRLGSLQEEIRRNTQRQPCEDVGKRQPSARHRRRPQKT